MPIATCPRCDTKLDVDDADLGYKVECPQCQSIFPAIAESVKGRRGGSRRRYDDDDDFDPDEEYRRRDTLDPRHRTRDLQRAEATISKPADGMIWTAAITIVLGLIAAGIMGAIGWGKVNNGVMQQDEEDGYELLAYAFIFGIISPIYHILILIGAQKAKRLEGTSWGTMSAIMGIGTIILCSPCIIVSCISTGYGIWLLVAMSKPEVKKAIRWNAQPPPRHRGSPLEDDDAPR